MDLLQDGKYAVERAVLDDLVNFEGGRNVVRDGRAAAVFAHGWYKCVFADVRDYFEYARRYGISGNVCLLAAPIDAPKVLGVRSAPCRTYAYLRDMPPPVDAPRGLDIKRLAPSLANTVADAYSNPEGGYDASGMARLMREKGVFGAIADGRLAGFIGRHGDGSMGMLEVFDGFKRRGIGGALERFLINYVMTFGRVPLCDVYTDNAASIDLQLKLGLTAGCGYTFWCEDVPENR